MEQLTKKQYKECLNRIAISKSSKEYKHLSNLIDQFYDYKKNQVDMLKYMRNQCRKFESSSKVAKASDYMRWFLGPYYRSTKSED